MKAAIVRSLVHFSLFFFGLGSFPKVPAQPVTAVFQNLQHEPSGIAGLEVMDILQDQFGFMWLATTKGLIRYDGHDMKVFRENPLDSTSLSDNFVRTILEDPSGDIWVGIGQGDLLRYDHLQENFIRIRRDTAAESMSEVQDLLLDQHNRLWVATNTGLETVEPGSIDRQTYFEPGEPLRDKFITGLVADHMGRIWISTAGSGLHLLDTETGQVQRVTEGFLPGADALHTVLSNMGSTADGKIWISDRTPRLYGVDPRKMTMQSYEIPRGNGPGNTEAWEIADDQAGGLWLGTHGDGLIHFTPASGRFTHFAHDPARSGSIASNSITALWSIPEMLWVGHAGRGVDQLLTGSTGIEPVPLQYAPEDTPTFSRVLEDRRGAIWVATLGNGLYRTDPIDGTTIHFRPQAGNPQTVAHNLIWDLHEDREGFIWLATHGGLQRVDPASLSFRTYLEKDGLDYRSVRSLWEDRSGILWVGTFAGLYRLDRAVGRLEFVTSPFEVPQFIVLDIYEDSSRHLWVSGFGIGVYRIDSLTGDSEHYQSEKGNLHALSSNIVLSIAEDRDQNVWLGMQGGGLNLFVPESAQGDPAHFRHWRPYNSALPDENVRDVFVGRDQHLWLSTDRGLFSFDTQKFRFTSHQLPGIQGGFNIDVQDGRSGIAYLRYGQRIYRFFPDSMNRNEVEPPVFITGFSINGEEVLPNNGMQVDEPPEFILDQSVLHTAAVALEYWQNDLAFEFSALNFIQPEKNRYRFKLEGYDEGWTETDAWNRRIRYTNLAPGDYQFKVMGSNNDAVWNETGKTLAVRIAPPWWRTWPAYLLYAGMFFLIVGTIYRFQLNRRIAVSEARRLQELDRAKNRLFTNVTHEFRTPLTVILGMAEKIQEEPRRWLAEGVEAISRNGWQVLQLVNQMLELSRLEAGSLSLTYEQRDVITYLSYLVQSQQSYAASKEIELRLDQRIDTLVMDFSPDALTRIVNNLLSNAIKFTPGGGAVDVVLDQVDDHLSIVVKDTGPGIPQESLPFIFDRFYQGDPGSYRETTRKGAGAGIGLALVRELVIHLKGRIEVENAPEGGAIFRVALPISRQAPLVAPDIHEGLAPTENRLPAPVELSIAASPDHPLVLLVEDNEDVANYTAACLAGRYRVELAWNGREGVAKAREMVPDLLICDVMMPEMDGYEACYQLKNDERTSHIPVVMLTAKADMDSRLTGLRQGADAYLTKPFHAEELDLRLDNLLQLSRNIRQRFEQFPKKQEYDPDFPREHAFLERIRGILLDHLDDDTFGIPELCRALGVSRTQLHRKLKALTGRSTSYIIRSIRLERARELVLQTEEPIAQIAYQVGFSNASYFSAVFAESFGMSPSEMREKRDLKQ